MGPAFGRVPSRQFLRTRCSGPYPLPVDTYMKSILRTACAVAFALVGATSLAHAGTQIIGTRVIYPAGEREVTVKVENNGSEPRLLQVWVDSGNPNETPETTRAPFSVTPPMSRIDAGKGQALRLMFTGTLPAQDRESVYWLNVLEIPPKPKASDADSENFLQFAVRTRIKIFYRPKGLPGDAPGAITQLGWRLVPQGSGYALECTNPSAYNVSFSSVQLKNTTVPAEKAFQGGGMCPAKGHETFPVIGDGSASGGKLSYSAINDYGGFVEGEANFGR
jgi:chaperone protein EcpD